MVETKRLKWMGKICNRLGWGLLTILTLGMLFSGCRRNLCKDATCENGGICVEGNCFCPSGYEGDYCEKRQIEKFVGLFRVDERCTAGSDFYDMTIRSVDSSLFDARISGVWGITDTLSALLSSDGLRLDFQRQAYSVYEVAGFVFFHPQDGVLGLEYSIFQRDSVTAFDICGANLTK